MAEIIDTDTVCNEYLEDGEHILWSQVPEDNRLHLNGGIPGIVFGSVLLIAGAAVFIVFFKIFDVVQAVMASALFVFFGILCIVSSFARVESFFLTNKRVMIFHSMTYRDIRHYNISYITSKKNKHNELGEITLFGPAVLRKRHSAGAVGGTDYKATAYTLYDVRDYERVIEMIKAQKDMPEACEKARKAERKQGF